MLTAPIPFNDRARLKVLRSYELLDTSPEEAFDVLTRLAASLCEVPFAAVSLVDEHRQWFKSHCGLGAITSTSRDVSLCGHAIAQTALFEIPDTRADWRFADNPLVTGEPRIRFYAGVPLINLDGMALGTLCVMDRRAHELTEDQRTQLLQLGQAVLDLIETCIQRTNPAEGQVPPGSAEHAAQDRLKRAAARRIRV